MIIVKPNWLNCPLCTQKVFVSQNFENEGFFVIQCHNKQCKLDRCSIRIEYMKGANLSYGEQLIINASERKLKGK